MTHAQVGKMKWMSQSIFHRGRVYGIRWTFYWALPSMTSPEWYGLQFELYMN